MTRTQKLAWLNLTSCAWFLAIMALEQVGMAHGALPMALFGLAGCAVAVALVWRKRGGKEVLQDERDTLYSSRSITAAYFAFTICLFAGVVAAGYAFPERSIPLGFLHFLAGGSWVVSMLAMSIATLVQYRKGS